MASFKIVDSMARYSDKLRAHWPRKIRIPYACIKDDPIVNKASGVGANDLPELKTHILNERRYWHFVAIHPW